MVEKFSDYEGGGFLNQEGTFVFEIMNYELKDGPKGKMAVFEAKSDAGTTTLYHSLNAKARYFYNNLIKACLKINTPDKVAAFECDYEVIGNQLIGKKFSGEVECETYNKEVKRPNEDGTFTNDVEIKESFKIKKYSEA